MEAVDTQCVVPVGAGEDLEDVGVVGHRGHIVAPEPAHRVEAGSRAGSVGVGPGDVGQRSHLPEHLDPSGAQQHDVARSHGHPPVLGRLVEVVAGDLVITGKPLQPLGRAHVEQHAPAGEVADVLDPEHGGAADGVDRRDRHPVVEGVVVAHVGQAVPVGGGLQGHGHDVVGEVGDQSFAVGVAQVGTVDLHHGVQRVDPPVHLADLHPAGVGEVEGARHPAAGAHQRGGVGHRAVGDQVERAEAVVVAPAPPVAHLVTHCEEGVGEAH